MAKHTGAHVDCCSPEALDLVAMPQLIDVAANPKPDGLTVSIPDADALGPAIKRAVAAKIPVILINSDPSRVQGARRFAAYRPRR